MKGVFKHRLTVVAVVLMLIIISFSAIAVPVIAKGPPPGKGKKPPVIDHTPAEFETVKENIISWPVGWSAIEPLFIDIVKYSKDTVTVTIAVDDIQEESYVKNILSANGISMDSGRRRPIS